TFLKGAPAMPGDLPDVSWFNASGHPMDWNPEDRSLVCLLAAWPKIGAKQLVARHVMILCHAGGSPREFGLPDMTHGIEWRPLLTNAAESPYDISPQIDGPPPHADGKLTLIERSMLCYVSA